VIAKEFCKAVREFFTSGKLLKKVNATVIFLVPKISTPRRVSDFRPIACCNVVYKCISKIMVNRIKGCLSYLVDQNQSAFIPSRQISDNVLLSQELLRGYHRKRGYARCAFKIDIQKAYDSVEWGYHRKRGYARCAFKIDIQKAYDSVEWCFLRDCLNSFGFHSTMVKWIMECISSTSFSINVNGDLRGFLRGRERNIAVNPHFKYHWKCKDLKITHLCFADDLMLFCHGDSKSVSILKNSLDEFGSVSGLLPSSLKSKVFFGKLPVRYLGVPLLSKRLYVSDCSMLIDKVYWSSMFILPVTISNEVERLMRDFLWNFGDFKRGKARIKWADVCKPKDEV
nr:hypothetical protein [Tanacetum cinerariifolium]